MAALGLSVAALSVLPTAPGLASSFAGTIPSLGSNPALIAANADAKPIVRGSKGNYTASVFVAATASRAWDVLTNYEAMAGVMPDIKEARVLNRHGNSVELQQVYQAPYTFGQRIRATLSMRETPNRLLTYQLIQGNQIKLLKGSWSITPTTGGVMLRHQIQVDPVIPGFLKPAYYELSEANLLQSMRILKRLIEDNNGIRS